MGEGRGKGRGIQPMTEHWRTEHRNGPEQGADGNPSAQNEKVPEVSERGCDYPAPSLSRAMQLGPVTNPAAPQLPPPRWRLVHSFASHLIE